MAIGGREDSNKDDAQDRHVRDTKLVRPIIAIQASSVCSLADISIRHDQCSQAQIGNNQTSPSTVLTVSKMNNCGLAVRAYHNKVHHDSGKATSTDSHQ